MTILLRPPAVPLHARRLRFRAAAGADRAASRRRAQRLAPARRHAAERRATVVSATCRRCCAPATCWSSTTPGWSRRGCSAPRRAAARSRRWSSGSSRTTAVLAQLRASKSPKPGSRLRFGTATASRPRCWAAAAPTARCSSCAFPTIRWPCSSATATCRCRPTSRATTASRTSAATRRCSRRSRARSPRRPRRCTSTTRCWRGSRRAASSAARITLHVGAGTFQPVRSEDLGAHAHAQRVLRASAPTRSRRSSGRGRAAAGWSRSARPACGRWNRRRGVGASPADAGSRRAAARPTLHHAGLRVPRRRPAAHQLPPAEEHPADAGLGLCRPRRGCWRSTGTRSPSATASSATATRCCSGATPEQASLSSTAATIAACSSSPSSRPKARPGAAT